MKNDRRRSHLLTFTHLCDILSPTSIVSFSFLILKYQNLFAESLIFVYIFHIAYWETITCANLQVKHWCCRELTASCARGHV